jgi:hypothetical protein
LKYFTSAVLSLIFSSVTPSPFKRQETSQQIAVNKPLKSRLHYTKPVGHHVRLRAESGQLLRRAAAVQCQSEWSLTASLFSRIAEMCGAAQTDTCFDSKVKPSAIEASMISICVQHPSFEFGW